MTIRLKDLPDSVRIGVEDTGVGIAQEDFPKVFDKFVQIAHGLDSVKGTGLGMPIAKQLVELHGGRIWFESEKGKGTTFYFTIPK